MVSPTIVEEGEPGGRDLKIERVDLVNPKEITRTAIAGRYSSAQPNRSDADGSLAFEITDGSSHPRLRTVVAGRGPMRFRIQELRAVIDSAVNELASGRMLVGIRGIVDAEHAIVVADRQKIVTIFQALLVAQVDGQRQGEHDHRDTDALNAFDGCPFAWCNPQNDRHESGTRDQC